MIRALFLPLVALAIAAPVLAQELQRIRPWGHVGFYRSSKIGDWLPGPCIEVAGTTNGAAVRLRTNCTVDPGPGNYAVWTLISGSAPTVAEGPSTQIRIFGKCLDVVNGVDADGTKLQIWDCGTNNPNQQFVVGDQDGTIRWANKNKCVDLPNGQPGQLQVWTCYAGNRNQFWNPIPTTVRFPVNEPARIKVVQRSAHTNPNLIPCLAAPTNADGGAVVTQLCSNGTQAVNNWFSAQGGAWSSTGVGPATQLRIYGNKCLDVTAGNGADGTKIQIWTCGDNNPNQLWTVDGDGRIRWAGQNRRFCLDLENGNWAQGVRTQIWTCYPGNLNQVWVAGPPV